VAASDVDRGVAPEVGKREIGLAIAAERRPEQGEQRLVLVDRKELAIAHGPALWREVERHESYFREERFRHR
jgi:hypothetical protein